MSGRIVALVGDDDELSAALSRALRGAGLSPMSLTPDELFEAGESAGHDLILLLGSVAIQGGSRIIPKIAEKVANGARIGVLLDEQDIASRLLAHVSGASVVLLRERAETTASEVVKLIEPGPNEDHDAFGWAALEPLMNAARRRLCERLEVDPNAPVRLRLEDAARVADAVDRFAEALAEVCSDTFAPMGPVGAEVGGLNWDEDPQTLEQSNTEVARFRRLAAGGRVDGGGAESDRAHKRARSRPPPPRRPPTSDPPEPPKGGDSETDSWEAQTVEKQPDELQLNLMGLWASKAGQKRPTIRPKLTAKGGEIVQFVGSGEVKDPGVLASRKIKAPIEGGPPTDDDGRTMRYDAQETRQRLEEAAEQRETQPSRPHRRRPGSGGGTGPAPEPKPKGQAVAGSEPPRQPPPPRPRSTPPPPPVAAEPNPAPEPKPPPSEPPAPVASAPAASEPPAPVMIPGGPVGAVPPPTEAPPMSPAQAPTAPPGAMAAIAPPPTVSPAAVAPPMPAPGSIAAAAANPPAPAPAPASPRRSRGFIFGALLGVLMLGVGAAAVVGLVSFGIVEPDALGLAELWPSNQDSPITSVPLAPQPGPPVAQPNPPQIIDPAAPAGDPPTEPMQGSESAGDQTQPEPSAPEQAGSPEADPATPETGGTESQRRERSDQYVEHARNLEQGGDWDGARTWYTQALEAFPNNPHALVGLARERLHADDPDAAVGYAERAVALRRRRPSYRVLLGDALNRAGRTADARAQYERALEIDPDHRAARQRLGG